MKIKKYFMIYTASPEIHFFVYGATFLYTSKNIIENASKASITDYIIYIFNAVWLPKLSE